MVSTILVILGLALTACVFVIGIILSFWIATAGIGAMKMDLKPHGIAIIGSSGVSAAVTVLMCCGILDILSKWLPIYGATGIF